ncbi:MAG: hypothetical protein R3F19_09825 [Verrucomicrobiales bacterium]
MKIIQNLIAGGAGLVAFIYLMLPSALPDFIPIVGAMDEMVATTILIASFSYFGLDVTRLFGRAPVWRKNSDDVIEVEAVRERAK